MCNKPCILQVEQEIALLEKELTPVERFAVLFLEQTDEQFSEEAIKEAEVGCYVISCCAHTMFSVE